MYIHFLGETVHYITLAQRGNRLMMSNGYSFCLHSTQRHGVIKYRCSNYAKKCKASVNVDSNDCIVKTFGEHNHGTPKYQVHYITLAGRGTRLAMYKGYSFCRHNTSKRGVITYQCSSFTSAKCKASIYVDSQDLVLKVVGQHDHDPFKYIQLDSGGLEARGGRLAMFRGYSFCKHSIHKDGVIRYRCSSYVSKKCKATIMVDSRGLVVKALGDHDHDPHQYVQVASGKYIKL
ncbi:Uncharacterized protein OBRU01_22275 [Operophtera brumata]|uniref:FLYWCH-type domain-containing protein n=1 Tax=Operophtera brumata TaxID=104452 RepID=A0A0L7KR02_OPEBR|nr:Uncharacterized protein OBRU01_22275 [Operophtera brumata]